VVPERQDYQQFDAFGGQDRDMAKRKPEFRIRTYGIYTQWDSGSKQLPHIAEVTTHVRADIDVEFGFVVNIKGAKNRPVHFCIDHPGILDAEGNRRPPFTGIEYVKTNDWDFYLGDTIWEPVTDKLGNWRITLEHNGNIVAEKTFELYIEIDPFAAAPLAANLT
jgi:hypothetical protein